MATKILAKVKTMLVEGKWFDLDETRMRRLAELRDRYLRERSRRKAAGSYVRDGLSFRYLIEFFGNCPLAELTPAALSRYKEHRLSKVSPQTVVRELGVIRNAFNVAMKEWEWCRENPFSRVSMPKLPRGRVRHLEGKEISALLNACENWLRPILLTAIHTGMRQGNLLALTWDEVDLERRRIVLDRTKNDERLAIPMNETLFGVLQDLNRVRLIGSNLVFHRNGKRLNKMTIGRALKQACTKAGIYDFRFHDLRHTFASLLIETGEDLYTIQKLLGHKDSRMTQRYAHLTEGRLASAVGTLDRFSHNLVIVGDEERGHAAVTP